MRVAQVAHRQKAAFARSDRAIPRPASSAPRARAGSAAAGPPRRARRRSAAGTAARSRVFDALGGRVESARQVAAAGRRRSARPADRRAAAAQVLAHQHVALVRQRTLDRPAAQRQAPTPPGRPCRCRARDRRTPSAGRRAAGPRPSRCRAASGRPGPAATPARRGSSGRADRGPPGAGRSGAAMSVLTAAWVLAANSGGAQCAARAR